MPCSARATTTFIWNPGDGDDIVDGRDGTDTLVFNGADAVEVFSVSDSGNGVQLCATSATSRWTSRTSSGSRSMASGATT